MFKRSMALILVLALLSMSFVAVSAQDDCSFEEQTVKIGGIAPMSAPGSVVGGVAMSWAFQLAANDINAACGLEIDGKNYKIEVLVGDSEGLPERGQAVAERLIFEDGVVGIVGVYHSAVGLATMGIMQENEIPTVFSEPWNDNVSANGIQEYQEQPARITTNEAGIDYIFRISPASSMVTAVAMEWLLELGVEDVVIIAENTDYGEPAAAADAALLEAAGVAVETVYIELGTEDFVPILSRIQARPTVPDAINLQVTGETAMNLTQQMSELGVAPTEDTICITNQVAFQSEQYWRTVPDGNYCAFRQVGIPVALYNNITTHVADAHRETFSEEVPSYALEAYDSVWILVEAMRRAGTIDDAAAIVAEIEATDQVFAQGRYWFKYGAHNPEIEEGDPTFLWHQWPDPAVVMVQYFEEGQNVTDAAVVWPPVYQTHGTSYVEPGTAP